MNIKTAKRKTTLIELGDYHDQILERIVASRRAGLTKTDTIRRALEDLQDKLFPLITQ